MSSTEETGNVGLCLVCNSSSLLFLFPQTFHCSSFGSPWANAVWIFSMDCNYFRDICSCIWSSTGCRVDICSNMVLCGLQGNFCCIDWSMSSSFSDTGVHMSVFHAFYPHCLCSILPLLKHVFTELPPVLLMVSVMSCRGSVLELAGIDCVQHRAAPGLSSQTLPHYQNPDTCTQCTHEIHTVQSISLTHCLEIDFFSCEIFISLLKL